MAGCKVFIVDDRQQNNIKALSSSLSLLCFAAQAECGWHQQLRRSPHSSASMASRPATVGRAATASAGDTAASAGEEE